MKTPIQKAQQKIAKQLVHTIGLIDYPNYEFGQGMEKSEAKRYEFAANGGWNRGLAFALAILILEDK